MSRPTGYVLPPGHDGAPSKESSVTATQGRSCRWYSSVSVWMNSTLYIEWFKFFLQNNPKARPVLLIEDLLIEDGHRVDQTC